jgi:predicted GNAT family acetyltransferase
MQLAGRFVLHSNRFGLTRNHMNELAIHHDVAGHQFEATVEGHHAYLAYMDLGQQTLDIYRTYVPNALRGKGIAAALTEHALQYAESMGYSVIPSCSYVERYMERRERGKQ